MSGAAVDGDRYLLGIERKWWIVAAILPSMALMGLSSTIIDIPEPIIIAELDSDHYRFQWVTGSTLIGTVLGMVMLSWLRDRFGLKTVYIGGLLIFTLGSLACGAAVNGPTLAVARFVQGFGKGLAVTTILATLWREFPLRKDLAMAFYGIGIYFGKAVAPPLAGYLTDYPSWRWIFYINVPVGLITFVLSWWILQPDKPQDVKLSPLDTPGMLLLLIALIAMVVCLDRGNYWGWLTSNHFVVALAVFLSSSAAFVVWQFKAEYPLVELRLFQRRTFLLAELIKSLFAGNFYAIISLLSSYMLTLRGYPRTTSGLVLLPGALTMGTTLMLGALLAGPWDRRSRLIVGMVLMAVGCWSLSVVDLYTDKRWIAAMFMVWGAGAGLVVSPVVCLPLEGLSQPEVVRSSSIKNMVRILPGTIVVSLVGILLERKTDIYFDAMRQSITYNRGVLEDVAGRLSWFFVERGSAGGSATQHMEHVIAGYVHANAQAYAYQVAFGWITMLCVVGAALGCLLPYPSEKA